MPSPVSATGCDPGSASETPGAMEREPEGLPMTSNVPMGETDLEEIR